MVSVTEKKLHKMRSSNLELFRILSMILIVAHHYVVNSGLMETIENSSVTFNTVFLLIFGAWGKMGINCFVLITGYFMCKSKITMKKFVKLLAEVMFYKITIYIIFLISGYESISFVGLIKAILPITKVEQNFTGCFLLFYFAIPFLSLLVHNLSQKMHLRLIALLFVIYVVFGTIPKFNVAMNYVSWYMVLFFIASYVSLYPIKIFENALIWGGFSALFVSLSAISVVACYLLGLKFGIFSPFLFVVDSNNFLALSTGFSLFMFFKNLKIKNSKVVNVISSATFGVLLIHANSETMRQWLWVDLLKNKELLDSNMLLLHAFASVICIYIICTIIDLARIHLIEKYMLKIWDKIEPGFKGFLTKIESKITRIFYGGKE